MDPWWIHRVPRVAAVHGGSHQSSIEQSPSLNRRRRRTRKSTLTCEPPRYAGTHQEPALLWGGLKGRPQLFQGLCQQPSRLRWRRWRRWRCWRRWRHRGWLQGSLWQQHGPPAAETGPRVKAHSKQFPRGGSWRRWLKRLNKTDFTGTTTTSHPASQPTSQPAGQPTTTSTSRQTKLN